MLQEQQYLFPDQDDGDDDGDDQSTMSPDFEGLRDASGLDTSPEWELVAPSDIPPPEVTSYHSVMRKAALQACTW